MAYVDYAFYTNTYLGNVVPENDFSRIAERTSEIIDVITRNRITSEMINRNDDLSNRIKKANCALAEQVYFENKNVQNINDGTIKSIKAGDETITYNTDSEISTYKTTQNQYMSALTTVSKYLSGTGLLYFGLCDRCRYV